MAPVAQDQISQAYLGDVTEGSNLKGVMEFAKLEHNISNDKLKNHFADGDIPAEDTDVMDNDQALLVAAEEVHEFAHAGKSTAAGGSMQQTVAAIPAEDLSWASVLAADAVGAMLTRDYAATPREGELTQRSKARLTREADKSCQRVNAKMTAMTADDLSWLPDAYAMVAEGEQMDVMDANDQAEKACGRGRNTKVATGITEDYSWAAALPDAYAMLAEGEQMDAMDASDQAEKAYGPRKSANVASTATDDLSWAATLPHAYAMLAEGDQLDAMDANDQAEKARGRANAEKGTVAQTDIQEAEEPRQCSVEQQSKSLVLPKSHAVSLEDSTPCDFSAVGLREAFVGDTNEDQHAAVLAPTQQRIDAWRVGKTTPQSSMLTPGTEASQDASDSSDDDFLNESQPPLRRITTDGFSSCECSFSLKASLRQSSDCSTEVTFSALRTVSQ